MKLIYIVRSELGMSKGKVASQVAHATLENYIHNLENKKENTINEWRKTGEAKIICKVQTREEMKILQSKAGKLGLVNIIIIDETLDTETVLAIGPASDKKLKFLDYLKLY